MEKKQKNRSIMIKIIKYFLIIIFSMALLNAYSSYRYKSFYSNFYVLLEKIVNIYSITLQVESLYEDIDKYSQTGLQEYKLDYDNKAKTLFAEVSRIKSSSVGDTYYDFSDLQNMIFTFDEKSKLLQQDYDNKVEPLYIMGFLADIKRLKENINNEAKTILLKQLNPIMTYYTNFSLEIRKNERLIYFLIIIITFVCIAFAIRFTRQITYPILQLVLKIQKVSKGQLDVGDVDLKTDDEINVLIESYNYMIHKIKEQIQEIQYKATVEKELKEEQIKNLEMTNLLNQSELQFLQSQINPHFLYNTMNTITALATIENAEHTKKMIECLSDILKYNLKKLNEKVTLMEEYQIIQDYVHIQEVRFGSRITYQLSYDSAIMDYYVPSMILQPFVENSIIHGLEPKEENGLLEVLIKDEKEVVSITIRDNGLGMDEKKLNEIMSYDKENKSKRNIGITNVLRRLEIKFGKNVVEIRSKLGQGTEVKINLPKDSTSLL